MQSTTNDFGVYNLLAFEDFKEALLASQKLIIPDYSLQWVLRVDASKYAVGSTLVQLRPIPSSDPNAEPQYLEEFLSFDSSKLSAPMQRCWDTHKLEGPFLEAYFLT
jgi:RNase H-like domain found in reverse transcriptase